MSAKYIIRLDDACGTFDLKKWSVFLTGLDKLGVKAIIAVIPEVKNLTLNFGEVKDFWKIIERWEKNGHTIGMHGYQHLYVTNNSGDFMKINNKSEFAGLPYKEQLIKISKSWNIFIGHNIVPKVWIAPAHTFDKNTLKAIRKKTKIRIISDGFFLYPKKIDKFIFIPQQLWRVKKMPFGLWTICYHPNYMSIEKINKELKKLSRIRGNIINLDQALVMSKKGYFWNVIDFLFDKFWYFYTVLPNRLKFINK